MKEWHSEHHFLTTLDGKLEAIYLSSYEWKVSLQVTLDFFFFVDVDVAVFSTCLKLRIQKATDLPKALKRDFIYNIDLLF